MFKLFCIAILFMNVAQAKYRAELGKLTSKTLYNALNLEARVFSSFPAIYTKSTSALFCREGGAYGVSGSNIEYSCDFDLEMSEEEVKEIYELLDLPEKSYNDIGAEVKTKIVQRELSFTTSKAVYPHAQVKYSFRYWGTTSGTPTSEKKDTVLIQGEDAKQVYAALEAKEVPLLTVGVRQNSKQVGPLTCFERTSLTASMITKYSCSLTGTLNSK